MAPQLLAQHTVHTDWLTRLTRLTRQTVRLTFFFQQLSAHSLTSKLQEPMCPKPQNHSKWLHWLHWLHQIIWFILNSLWLFLILLFDYFWLYFLMFDVALPEFVKCSAWNSVVPWELQAPYRCFWPSSSGSPERKPVDLPSKIIRSSEIHQSHRKSPEVTGSHLCASVSPLHSFHYHTTISYIAVSVYQYRYQCEKRLADHNPQRYDHFISPEV